MMARDYAKEDAYKRAHGIVGGGHNGLDAIRHRARYAMEKKLGRKLKKGEQVDHIIPLAKHPKDPNAQSNVRVISVNANEKAGARIRENLVKGRKARKK